jgi:hypothetical protein
MENTDQYIFPFQFEITLIQVLLEKIQYAEEKNKYLHQLQFKTTVSVCHAI